MKKIYCVGLCDYTRTEKLLKKIDVWQVSQKVQIKSKKDFKITLLNEGKQL